MDPYLPVPFQAAEEIAKAYAKDIVIVVAVDHAHEKTHFATWGRSADDKANAAILGDRLGVHLTGTRVQETHQDFRSAKEVAATKIAAAAMLAACKMVVEDQSNFAEYSVSQRTGAAILDAIAQAEEAGLK